MMPSMTGSYSDSVIFARYPSEDDTGDGEMPMQFHSEGDDLLEPVPAKELAQDVSPKPDQHWQEVCFIQFLGLSDEEAADAIASNPGMEGLAGSGFHRIGPARTAAAPLHPRPQPPFPSAIVPLPGPTTTTTATSATQATDHWTLSNHATPNGTTCTTTSTDSIARTIHPISTRTISIAATT